MEGVGWALAASTLACVSLGVAVAVSSSLPCPMLDGLDDVQANVYVEQRGVVCHVYNHEGLRVARLFRKRGDTVIMGEGLAFSDALSAVRWVAAREGDR